MVKRLAELRTEIGLSQSRLAKAVGTTQQTISKYEKQKIEPPNDTLLILAGELHVSVDYLLGADEQHTLVEHFGSSEEQRETELFFRRYLSLPKDVQDALKLIVSNYFVEESNASANDEIVENQP